MSEKKSFFEVLSPKQLFLMGGVVSLFVLLAVGFFILLSKQLSTGSSVAGVNPVATTGGNKNPTQQLPSQAAGNTVINIASVTEDDWYKGSKDADISIIEYSDTECPFCKRFHSTMNKIIENYGDSVKWVYRHAPLDSLHRKARREALALECAGNLAGNEGFWAYTDRLFEVTPSNDGLLDEQLFTIATDVGLNEQAFRNCIESEKFAAEVQEDLEDAQRAGLRGTPYSVLIVGEEKIPISGAQPYAQVEQIIQSVLK